MFQYPNGAAILQIYEQKAIAEVTDCFGQVTTDGEATPSTVDGPQLEKES